jgi:hypothetical protein
MLLAVLLQCIYLFTRASVASRDARMDSRGQTSSMQLYNMRLMRSARRGGGGGGGGGEGRQGTVHEHRDAVNHVSDDSKKPVRAKYKLTFAVNETRFHKITVIINA